MFYPFVNYTANVTLFLKTKNRNIWLLSLVKQFVAINALAWHANQSTGYQWPHTMVTSHCKKLKKVTIKMLTLD